MKYSDCFQPSSTASLIVQLGTYNANPNHSMSPVESCGCNIGHQYFWNSTSQDSLEKSYAKKELAYTLSSFDNCPNMCITDDMGHFYTPTDDVLWAYVDFIPYCEENKCHVNAMPHHDLKDEDGKIYNKSFATDFGNSSFHIKAISISCFGCSKLKLAVCNISRQAYEPPPKTASLMIAPNTFSLQLSDVDSPIAMCQCNQGMKYFWEPGTENLPYDGFHWKHIAFALMRYDDANYCDDIRICDEHGNCYKLHEDILMIFFIPYCEANECHMYAWPGNCQHNGCFKYINGTSYKGLNSTNYFVKPIGNSSKFIKAKMISCFDYMEVNEICDGPVVKMDNIQAKDISLYPQISYQYGETNFSILNVFGIKAFHSLAMQEMVTFQKQKFKVDVICTAVYDTCDNYYNYHQTDSQLFYYSLCVNAGVKHLKELCNKFNVTHCKCGKMDVPKIPEQSTTSPKPTLNFTGPCDEFYYNLWNKTSEYDIISVVETNRTWEKYDHICSNGHVFQNDKELECGYTTAYCGEMYNYQVGVIIEEYFFYINSVFIILACIDSLALIFLISFVKSLRTGYGTISVLQAVSDILLLLIITVEFLMVENKFLPQNSWLYKAFKFLFDEQSIHYNYTLPRSLMYSNYTLKTLSALLRLVKAMNRFVALYIPLSYKDIFTVKRSIIICLICFLFCSIVFVPIMFLLGDVHELEGSFVSLDQFGYSYLSEWSKRYYKGQYILEIIIGVSCLILDIAAIYKLKKIMSKSQDVNNKRERILLLQNIANLIVFVTSIVPLIILFFFNYTNELNAWDELKGVRSVSLFVYTSILNYFGSTGLKRTCGISFDSLMTLILQIRLALLNSGKKFSIFPSKKVKPIVINVTPKLN